MATSNITRLISTIRAASSMVSSRGNDAVSASIGETTKTSLASQGIGDISLSSTTNSNNTNSPYDFVWGSSNWGSKTYKVSS